ncbi:unnamed protein product [Brassicogethes aeneus]|uniref:TIR domain-containing protein n=1 Tax=Brassicogethes aeneus TaxID=1431903 RepID=A0A9P0BFX2_BRAAE|nr:unnamed protein product [Brassicogethes aeneus]
MLPSGIFNSLKSLEILYLNNISLTILANGIFNSLESLNELHLENNLLKNFPSGIFNSLKNLNIFNLGNNSLNLQFLPEDIFKNLRNLRYLNLEHNLVNDLITPLFYLFNINELNLSYNQNLNIDICLIGFRFWKLKTLNVKNTNSSNMFKNGICQLRECTDIDLSHTKINKIRLTSLFVGCNSYSFSNNNIKIIDTNFIPRPSKNINLNMYNTTISCNWENYDFITSVPNIKDNFKILNYETIKCSNNKNLMMFNWTKNKENIIYPMSSVMDKGYTCPRQCNCLWYPFNLSFIVDCSNRKLKEIPIFSAPNYIPKRGEKIKVKNVKVDLQNNILVEGPSQDDGYDNVTVLILSENKIEDISWIPPNIQDLYLDHNNISFLNDQLIDSLYGPSLRSLKLGDNPFICYCTTVKLKQYLSGNSQVVDKQNVKCDGTNIQIIYADNICTFPWVIMLVLLFLLFLISSLVASYYKWKKYIKMWLYSKGWLLWFATEEELDKDKVYDVFLSFSQKDDDFVLGTLLPKLESEPNSYKVCVHYRDWIPGVLITEQVITSVRDSRRTLVIVSKNFLESCWTKMEFRTAYTQALTEGRTRVIVLVYGEVDMTEIDGDLSVYMKMTTYIKWEDPWFWRKMLYALPHKNRNNQIRTTTV